MHEIDENGERTTDFAAVILLEDNDGEHSIDFVTDKNLIESIAYEIHLTRRGLDSDGNPVEDDDEEAFEDDELFEDEAFEEEE